jgi:hypothetical protein
MKQTSNIVLTPGVSWAQFGATTNPHVHVDQVLSNIVQGYRPNARIWDQVAPQVSVGKQSDFYLVHDRGDALRRESALRAPGRPARIVTRAMGSGTFFALNYALKMAVPIEDEVNADPMYRTELLEGNAFHLVDLLDLDIDARVATLVTTVANVGSGAGVSSAWSTNNGNPIGDMNAAIDIVEDSTGKRPNQATMGSKAWRSLRRHTDVRNLIFGTNNGGGYPSTTQVANLFELDRINVGGTYENTGNELQGETISAVWADHVVLHRTAPDGPGQRDVSAFRSFRWNAPGLANMQVERHPFDSKIKAQEIEVGYYQDERVTGRTYAYVIRAVNSST